MDDIKQLIERIEVDIEALKAEITKRGNTARPNMSLEEFLAGMLKSQKLEHALHHLLSAISHLKEIAGE